MTTRITQVVVEVANQLPASPVRVTQMVMEVATDANNATIFVSAGVLRASGQTVTIVGNARIITVASATLVSSGQHALVDKAVLISNGVLASTGRPVNVVRTGGAGGYRRETSVIMTS